MYKAKIISIVEPGIYKIDIPSLGFSESRSYSIGQKGYLPDYVPDDLVIVSSLNSGEWVILGYVYGQKGD